MRTYGDVVDDLARAVAQLVSTPLDVTCPGAVLAARAAVFAGIRQVVDALTAARTPPERPDLADLELDPARALRAALHHLPPVRPPTSLTDAIADSLVSEPWAKAASASLELLKYEEPLRSLRGPSRWTAFGDVAEMAVALATVDEELKAALPGAGLPNRRSLASVRIAATAVAAEARRHPVDREIDNLLEPVPARPFTIRRAADIPVALDRITAMIRVSGEHITMHDLGGVLEPLARGLNDASQVLSVAAWHLDYPEPVREMARHAEQARDSMKSIIRHRMRIMTIGPPNQDLIGQAMELRGAIRTLLSYSGTDDGANNLGPARASHVVTTSAWSVVNELRLAVGAARDVGRLLVVERGLRPGDRPWAAAHPRDHRIADLLADLESAARVVRPSPIVRCNSERALGLASVGFRDTGRTRRDYIQIERSQDRIRRHMANPM